MISLKKNVFFFLLFLFFPIAVQAKDLVLDELTILNGNLSIPFESLNNEYTVILKEDVEQLELEYKVEEGVTIFIEGNKDLKNNSVVTITLNDEKKTVVYHLQVLKEEKEIAQNVFLEAPIPEKTNFMYEYKNYIIPSTCLLLLFLVFKILFHKHKK